MDLFQSMRSFVTTVNTGSMSAAANQLDITPAMVGQHIAALETRLGTRLLHRTTRRQSLTDFGESYLEQCKDILERIALADMEAESQSHEAKGTLRITAPVSFGAASLMPKLKEYRELSPLVKLDIMLTDRHVDLVDEGIDVAFRVGQIADSRVIQRALMPYKMVICASPEYLSQYGEPTHPEDLTSHNIISFTSASKAPLSLQNGETKLDIKLDSIITVNNGHALISAAKAGMGIIVQPQVLLEEALNAGDLQPILSDWQLGERQVSLLYYRDKSMTPRVSSFIHFALKAFKTNPLL